jgi:hypothetical protein
MQAFYIFKGKKITWQLQTKQIYGNVKESLDDFNFI